MPWPMSSAVKRTSPASAGRAATTNSGTIHNAPVQRIGTPRGASHHATPTIAHANAAAPGIAPVHTATGAALSHCSQIASHATRPCAACSNREPTKPGSTAPASASGVTTKLTSGIATAFASGLTIDT